MNRRRLLALAPLGALGLLTGGDAVQPLGIPNLAYSVAWAKSTASATDFRVGTVLNYAADGSIEVSIGAASDGSGGTLTQAVYMSNYFPTVGDVVLLGKMGASWIVFGAFGGQQSRLVPVSDFIAAGQNCTSTSYGNLATVGPTVTAQIGSSGRALLTMSTYINVNVADYGFMGVDISGANTQAATDSMAVQLFVNLNITGAPPGNLQGMFSLVRLLTGLNPGATTFTAKYRNAFNISPINFADRLITVTPY